MAVAGGTDAARSHAGAEVGSAHLTSTGTEQLVSSSRQRRYPSDASIIENQDMRIPVLTVPIRRQGEARRIIDAAYTFKCCAVCGLEIATCLHLCHLDHNAGNNSKENLARLCPTHHWMFDAGLYPIEAIRILRDHWQKTRGLPDHKPRMKDAGAKAALTRKRRAAAAKAVVARLANAARRSE